MCAPVLSLCVSDPVSIFCFSVEFAVSCIVLWCVWGVCVCECVHVCVCVCVYVYVCLNVSVCVCVCMHVCMLKPVPFVHLVQSCCVQMSCVPQTFPWILSLIHI